MSWYREGSIQLTNGSVDVIGTGTAFKSEVRFSDILLVGGVLYEVNRVESDTKLKLTTPFTGATVASTSFAVIRNLTNASNFDLMKKIEEFLTDRQRSLDEFVNWVAADPVTTGGEGVGVQPLTDRYGVVYMCKTPRQMAWEGEKIEAVLTDAEGRLTAIGNQEAWATQILGYKDAAAASATLASKWADNAENTAVTTGKYSAKHHAIKAAASQADVTTKQADVTTKHDNVVALEADAEASKNAAATSATQAATSATSAAGSATGSQNSATAAQTSANAAAASKTGADTAKAAAQVSETNASNSASASASSAAASASSSATSKDWADKTSDPVTGSLYSSKHHAIASAASATQAATSATDAAASKTDVTTRQADVVSRQSNVLSLETSATASKNAAAASATNAATSEANASTSANSASTSATSASTSMTKAGKWAEEAVDVVVETGKYSAKHYSVKAAASATNAATSATNAATSATTATTAKTAAETANASAQAAKTAAEAAKTAAEAARVDAMNAASSMTGSMAEYGSIDLSGNVYPDKPQTAGFWKVTVGGTIGAVTYGVGDTLVYSKNLDDFYKIDNTESVSSVNGLTGTVVVTPALIGALPTAGTAAAATKLATARTISLTGDATGSVAFDGSANASIAVVIADDSHNHIISNVDGLQAALDAKQASLGFTPVQQGGGAGQNTNKVYVGWSATGLLLQVDATNFANVWPISISKNAATATKLTTAVTINGVSFDGSANITVEDATKQPLIAAGTNAQFWRGDKTWQDFASAVRGSALTGLSTTTSSTILAADTVLVAAGKLQAQINTLATAQAQSAAVADKLSTARTISLTGDATGSVAFDGSANASIAVVIADDSHNHIISNVDGLQAALDAKAAASHTHSYLPLTGGTLTGRLNGTSCGMVGTGNDYSSGAYEVIGNGASNTVFPTIGFHQPGAYAASLQLRGAADFRFYAQGAAAYANVTANIFYGTLAGNASSASSVPWSGVSGKPTTLGDYGITNGYAMDGVNTGWFRSSGGSGWYNETFTGGIHMTDATYVRTYNGKSFLCNNVMRVEGTTPQVQLWDSDHSILRYLYADGGNIGFLTSAGGWALTNDNSGNTTSTGNLTAYSDIRLKKNIELIPDALAKVVALRGVTYERIDTGQRQTGVIAQEVQAILPEAVMTMTDEQQTLSVAYGNLVGLLIEAIKELKAEVDVLKQGAK